MGMLLGFSGRVSIYRANGELVFECSSKGETWTSPSLTTTEAIRLVIGSYAYPSNESEQNALAALTRAIERQAEPPTTVDGSDEQTKTEPQWEAAE